MLPNPDLEVRGRWVEELSFEATQQVSHCQQDQGWAKDIYLCAASLLVRSEELKLGIVMSTISESCA